MANLQQLRYHWPVIGQRMPETTIPSPPGFSQLSKAEQVRYLQALWDHISENPAALPVPESHLKLVEQRLKRHLDVTQPVRTADE